MGSNYDFQALAHGYCPVEEKIKPTTPIILSTNTKPVVFDNFTHQVPEEVHICKERHNHFQKFSFVKKEDYENHMKVSYGLGTDVNLNVSVRSEGRWLRNAAGSDGFEKLSFEQDIQIGKFQLTNPSQKEMSREFRKDLDALPTSYDDTTKQQFKAFFSRYGTHLIIEEAIGGYIRFDCTVDQSKFTSGKLNHVESTADLVLKSFVKANAEFNYSYHISKLKHDGVLYEELHIAGGCPPMHPSLDTETCGSLQKWQDTICEKPARLPNSMELYPYYEFLEHGPKYYGLYDATMNYIENKMSAVAGTPKKATTNCFDSFLMGSSCFPKGAQVTLQNRSPINVERIGGTSRRLLTLKLHKSKLRDGETILTDFCTYLDAKPDAAFLYLLLEFDNGKCLKVSPDHMIFKYLKSIRVVVGTQAKYFEVGDRAVYVEPAYNNVLIKTPRLTKISSAILIGAYAPLTGSGTLIVDNFFVTSYAYINSFGLAHLAMFPLKLWCKLSKGKMTSSVTDLSKEISYNVDKNFGINGYAKFLIRLRNTTRNLQHNSTMLLQSIMSFILSLCIFLQLQ